MKKFQPQEYETKWMEKWIADGLFQKTYDQKDVSQTNKMYLLYAFAYPSGSGLHVGHVEPVTALDILARYYRSIGKNVFFPVGWDAFGLPAENFAIKSGIHPAETTKSAIDAFRTQIKRIGVSYDWATEIATSHPGYYKWTQWLFLQFYNKGLAYKKSAPVNWCPSCQTVLANEQVVEGKCERCGTEVIQKEMKQWFFKITDYKDELISGLDQVDWPKATKLQQLNWIGKSEGAIIKFEVRNAKSELSVFTTRPDTLYGATFLVVAPEHDLITAVLHSKFEVRNANLEQIRDYVQRSKRKTEEERLVNKEKTGVFTGLYAVNPVNGKEIPVWVADYVLVQYGTGAIMAVPAHDERDYAFAKEFDLDIIPVIQVPEGESLPFTSKDQSLINSDTWNGHIPSQDMPQIIDSLAKQGIGERKTTYKLRDWLISRQRYWGAPIPIVYDPEGNAHPVRKEHLPWMLPTDVDFKPTGESPLKASCEFKERVEKLYGAGWKPEYDTMDTFVDSSWYYLRYTDPRNENEFAQKEQVKKWMPVDFYMIGPEHIVLHLLYSRFFTKFLRDEGYLEIDEPFSMMRHQGMILGPDNRKMSKSKGNVINPDDVIEEYGADTLRMYEMFMGPIDADKPWSQTSVQGVYRFLKRVWYLFEKVRVANDTLIGGENENLVIKLNQTIQKVTEDIPALKFNTAIAAMMEFLNEIEAFRGDSSPSAQNDIPLTIDNAQKFLKILSPFAPFMTEEIWYSVLGNTTSIHTESWPSVDDSILEKSDVTIPVQINGKMRGTVIVPTDANEDKVISEALKKEDIKKYVREGKYKKVIFIAGKILNIIV